MSAAVVLVVAADSLVAQTRTVPKQFDNVRTLGRALAEFKDGRIQALAAYDYSQVNHDSRWLLIEIGGRGRDQPYDGSEAVLPIELR